MKDIIFVFSGQGAQSVGMGKDIYDASEAAQILFDKADDILGWSVKDVCFNGPADKLTESKYCQPAIYTMSVACLVAFNERYNTTRMLGAAGLSLGEFAALCASDVFSFEDGLKLVSKRGQLMDEACRNTTGGMASVLGGNLEKICEVCNETGIDVANYNCPGQTVISGEQDRLKDAIASLKEKGIRKIIPLKVAGAFHSRLMQGAAEEFKEVLEDIEFKTPIISVAQNYPGSLVRDTAEIKENLYKQVSGSVKWEDCVKTLVEKTGARQIVEFGPGSVLTGLIKRIDVKVTTCNINNAENLRNF